MEQPKASWVLSLRQREQLEWMAGSALFSPRPAVCAPPVLPNASGKRIQQMAHQARILEINGVTPKSISTPEMPVSGPIVT
jgi:hypothetical protein